MTSSVDRFGVKCHGEGSEVTVRVVGEVDMATAGVLAAQLDRAINGFNGGVRVNLAGVTFMDLTGLHALLRARTALAASVAAWSWPSRVGRRRACSSWPVYSTPLNWPPSSAERSARVAGAGQHSISTHTCLPAAVGTHPHPSVTARPDATPPTIGGHLEANARRRPVHVVDLDAQPAIVERCFDRRRRGGVHDSVARQLRHDELRVAGDGVRAWDSRQPLPQCVTSEGPCRRRPPAWNRIDLKARVTAHSYLPAR